MLCRITLCRVLDIFYGLRSVVFYEVTPCRVLEIFESCENRMEETLWVSLSYSTFVFAYWQFLGDIYETNYELQMISPILYYLVFLTPVATFSCHQMVIFPATYMAASFSS